MTIMTRHITSFFKPVFSANLLYSYINYDEVHYIILPT